MRFFLPDRIAYLTPVLDQLEAMAPDEIDESMDTSLLSSLLANRIRELEAPEAAQVLREDRRALEAALREQPEHPGYFVAAYLEGGDELIDHLPSHASKPPRTRPTLKHRSIGKVAIDPPQEFTVDTIKGMLVMMKPGACAVTVQPLTQTEADQRFEQFISIPGTSKPESVRLEGFAAIRAKFEDRYFYNAEAGGAFLSISVQVADESMLDEIEASLCTIREL